MATGDAFSPDQVHRIERAIAAAERETGVRFSVRVGGVEDEPRLQAERLLANIADSPRDPVVLVVVAPTERLLEIITTPAARRRISDHAAGLAVLSMTSSFGVGDIVGGIVAGIRQLADAAGPETPPAGGFPGQSVEASSASVAPHALGMGISDPGVIEGQAIERIR